jgi:hypothetical protein
MKTVFLVKEEEAGLARVMEQKLLDLPPQSGILFAGVSVKPSTEENVPPVYEVWVGCCRDFSEGLMKPLVELTLRDELAAGVRIHVEAHRGQGRRM